MHRSLGRLFCSPAHQNYTSLLHRLISLHPRNTSDVTREMPQPSKRLRSPSTEQEPQATDGTQPAPARPNAWLRSLTKSTPLVTSAPNETSSDGDSAPASDMPASIPDIEDLGPSNWRLSYSLIKMMRAPGGPAGEAPVDFMGCSSLADPSAEPKVQRFQTLVSLLLSSKTRDEMTAAAVRALQAMPGGLNAHTVAGMTEEELAPYIKTVGFSKQKAKYLRGVGRACVELDGDIPTDIKGLTALPGIGPKMGYLTLSSAWGKVDGIGVDTHVHRISNRLRWVKSKDAEGTRAQLERWLPKDLWADVNLQLVGFGQMVCKDTPKCNRCLVGYVGACPSATVKPAPDAGALRERLQGMLDGGDAAALAQWVRERVDRQREEEEEAPTSKKSKK